MIYKPQTHFKHTERILEYQLNHQERYDMILDVISYQERWYDIAILEVVSYFLINCFVSDKLWDVTNRGGVVVGGEGLDYNRFTKIWRRD